MPIARPGMNQGLGVSNLFAGVVLVLVVPIVTHDIKNVFISIYRRLRTVALK